MSHEQLRKELLDTFVSQKYHWKSLSHEQQMSMAIEVIKHRYLEKQYLEFIDMALGDKEALRKYREVIGGQYE
jgi:hypothetical protein